ncbi:hypothetical protein DEV91_108180 [Phyllobacterium brassicacearum]|nr:hypothetical protein DEV91_108180 [Phyllobacterium brassicacearum]
MIKDSNHPFFRPLWRRVAVVAFCVAWAIFEFATGTPFWGVLALGFAGYGVWQFFIIFDASEPAAGTEDKKEE